MNSKSRKIFIVLLVSNLLAIILIGVIVTLIYSNYKKSSGFRQQAIDEVAKISDLVSLKQIVSDTKDSREYINSLFVNKEKVIDFLSFLESLGNLSGADVKVISVDEGTPDNPIDYTAVRFEAVGTWSQVFEAVSLIDHIPLAFSVLNLQISQNHITKDQKKPTLLWSAMVNAKVLKPISSI